jgi:tRNA A37 threonylcarbamoyladenosine synthetase subunit TsaC/SUA5/YrdC
LRCRRIRCIGLGADPFRPDAVARVFAVKGRTRRALPLIAADPDQVADRLGALPESRRASRFWPGPLTLLLAPRRRWR